MFTQRLTDAQRRLSVAQAFKQQAEDNLALHIEALANADRESLTAEEAGLVIQQVTGETQIALEEAISGLVRRSLTDVFGSDAYNFVMRFVPHGNKTHVEFVYETKDGNELSPLRDSGIGTVDVAAFALRASFLHISKNRRILLLDEPFKNISAAYRPIFLQLVQRISDQLHIQFIIVTHQNDIVDIANNVIRVTKSGVEVLSDN